MGRQRPSGKFKDIVENDLTEVFCNLDEYGEKHKWDSLEITCVLDDDILMREFSSEFEALPKGSHLVYVPHTELPKKPHISDTIRFDGNIYTIDEVRSEMGMYAIYLARGKV